MVELILPPDPLSLLPPLLAFLPLAFVSARPPPDLLLLLSPILRQRLQFVPSASSSTSDNWLKLLCWDKDKSDKLKDVVENGTFEPHPVSGEIEVGELDTITFKRFDQETLRAQIPLPEWSLTAFYLWCPNEEGSNAWKLAELLPYDGDLEGDDSWTTSIQEADEISKERIFTEAMRDGEIEDQAKPKPDNDDDDYWAMYDKSPGKAARSPAPNSLNQANGQTEAEFYEQYGGVQPAMDNHDPSEESQEIGESSLDGGALGEILKKQTERLQPREQGPAQEAGDSSRSGVLDDDTNVSQPVPSSSASVGSGTVSRLEESAERQTASEMGIRQHISTSMKSMFRLARSAGIDREEFERIVQRELEAFSMLERDE